ncbi:hypothetical protein FUA23_00190 [Neolewinella aurantiaca]|uniref:Lipoprotein n=1 Tax=Neolewinella aurantiaca TaxID=2602767 RepID=A0A5C7FYG9_9BACT|nr:hypothetical protein [Neolewinella aurantiaca]TXF91636.1 hypothetical protein FUA23_00190 [Neolewinella aurantiaca]
MRNLIYLLLMGLFCLTTVSCGPKVQTLVDQGNYDETIQVAKRKLVGERNKSPKYVAALETAFNKANDEDLTRARRIETSGNPDWKQIHSYYRSIRNRADEVRPLTPLIDKDGHQAVLRFVEVNSQLNDAAGKAAEQMYLEGERLLELGRQGDKAAAREAYETFEGIAYYRQGYKGANLYMTEAEELGMLYITVEMRNESGAYLPAGFEEALFRINAVNMEDRWRKFETTRKPDRQYDYVARIIMRNIDVSPERSSERQYTDEKEITDGTEYVLDENGNVAKDSLGNDITQPKEVIVRADVIEVLQTKVASVTAGFELYDVRNRRIVDQGELTAQANFENYASTFQGDRRALSSASARNIGNRPVEFPSNEQLILDAAEVLKDVLSEQIATSYKLI